jgi:hypothetical protein
MRRAIFLLPVLGRVMGALLLTGCPMEDDPSESEPGLNADLKGTWEFSGPNGSDRYVIDDTTLVYSSALPDEDFEEKWAGEIAYAYGFTEEAGIIIIEYTTGHKQVWSDWTQDPEGNWVSTPLDPQPEGNFYGIYYTNLSMGVERDLVYFSNTSDQNNGYGPTEAVTLEQAKGRFTLGNMNNYIDLTVSSPMTKK